MTLGEAISRSVAGLSATEFVQWLFVFVWCVEEQTRKGSVFCDKYSVRTLPRTIRNRVWLDKSNPV
ncbi:MAG: hypothetical protein ACK5PB_16510 [Pirellula sp.]